MIKTCHVLLLVAGKSNIYDFGFMADMNSFHPQKIYIYMHVYVYLYDQTCSVCCPWP